MALLEITLLGGFRARLPSGAALAIPTRKGQALVAYLAVPPGQSHPRDKLATLLWGDMQEPQARASLRQAIFALRKALEPDGPLAVEGGSVALRAEAVEVDVARFERLVARGTRDALEAAAALYRGAFLDGLALREAPFEEWLVAERARLQELAVAALARLLALQRGAGDLEPAVQTALHLLAIDPTQEPAHRALMRLLVQLGRRGTALRQYQACVGALARELHVEPAAETKALYQEILASRPASPVKDEMPAVAGVPAGPPPTSGNGPSGHEGPLVGREPELARLHGILDQTWARQGRVVTITGEMGIGKSRLGSELLSEAGRRGGLAAVGRCYETEQILPFGPWVDALHALPAEALAEAGEALRPAWRIELARLLPELGPERPAPDASPGALRLFEAVAQFLHGLAARQPLVILLEDLHWADEMSIRLLAFLGRRVPRAAVLVVATVRDEDVGEAPLLRQTLDELTRGGQAAALALRALSRADTAALVRHLARPALESTLAEQVWRASDGNPFMIVETVRAVDAGAPLSGSGELPLPERIRDVVGHRLERLTERARRLVAVAAVIGRQFDFQLLQRAAEVTEGEATEGVEELVRQRVLHGVGEALEFMHDRVREVAVARLLPAVRKSLHRRVAEALQGLHARDLAPHLLAVATHYQSAEIWDRAAALFEQAGDAAFARIGRREAAAGYEQALFATARMPADPAARGQACDLHFKMARVLYATGDFARARQEFAEAEAEAQALGDDRRLAQILGGLAYVLGSEGEHESAIEAGDLALSIARSIADTALEVWTSVAVGRQHFALGRYRLGAEGLQRTVGILRTEAIDWRAAPRGLLLPPVGARTWLAQCLGQLGQFQAAIEAGEEAVRLADAIEAAMERVWAYYCLGQVLVLRGEAERGQPLLERAVALCEDGRFPIYAPRARASLGLAYARGGRLQEALTVLERAAEDTSSINLRYGEAMVLGMLAHVNLAAGRHDRARELAGQALGVARARGERGDEAWALHLIGSVAGARAPLDAAAAQGALEEALALARDLGMRPLEARSRLGLGRIHLATGRVEPARMELARAAEDLRAMGMALWVGDAEMLLARLG